MKTLLGLILSFVALVSQCNGKEISLAVNVTNGFTYHIQFDAKLDRFFQDVQVISISNNYPAVGGTSSGNVMNLSVPANGHAGFYQAVGIKGQPVWYGWTWQLMSTFIQWHIGTNQTVYVHNDRPWEWYNDKTANDNDCGPLCAVMLCEWFNQFTTASLANARVVYPEGGGGWLTTDIVNYLNLYGVSNSYALGNVANVTNLLAQTNNLVFCMQVTIPQDTNPDSHAGSYYPTSPGEGHFIVAKGFGIVDGVLWIECYDPHGGLGYPNDPIQGPSIAGTPLGRDRWYKWTDIQQAIANWWPYLIVVKPSNSVGNIAHIRLAKQPVSTLVPPAARGW